MKNTFNDNFKQFEPRVILLVKRIYILSFNIYAWYWLYREIFVRNSTDFESYLLWFFTTAGMYYFVLDNNDVFFKKKK
jgi:hypothetical protein